jgi:hypothetical protein
LITTSFYQQKDISVLELHLPTLFTAEQFLASELSSMLAQAALIKLLFLSSVKVFTMVSAVKFAELTTGLDLLVLLVENFSLVLSQPLWISSLCSLPLLLKRLSSFIFFCFLLYEECVYWRDGGVVKRTRL